MTKVKVIEAYDAKLFEEKINEANSFYKPFATQTHIFYHTGDECMHYVAILYYAPKVI